MEREVWFENMWRDYQEIAPNVSKIKSLIESAGNTVQNDHIAFRTYNIAPINIASLTPLITALGYEAFDTYNFVQKRLSATSFVHPDGGPRIFISELRVEEFSDETQTIVHALISQIESGAVSDADILYRGKLWEPISHGAYLAMREETEYGAWVAAHGLRPNHFTVAVNDLTTFKDLPALLEFVKSKGFELNASGGEIKGSPEVMLEQGSTMADSISVEFSDGTFEIPTCYYEFAYRHLANDGKLFNGFVTGSADKIFESTNAN